MKTSFADAFRALAVSAAVLLAPSILAPQVHAAEAFEMGPGEFSQRPGGKEADSIVGDFVLRSDRVEAVIAGNLPLRRPNMSTFYGDDGITPGNLYDLTLTGTNNDQMVIFCPNNQRGPINYVRILEDTPAGEAAIETVTSAAKNSGLYLRHEYRVKDGLPGVFITTTARNESKEPKDARFEDVWAKFRSTGSAGAIKWADAIDPDDKAGYAFGWVDTEGAPIPEGLKGDSSTIKLEPGEEVTATRFMAVGISPAAAVGEVLAFQGESGTLRLTMKDGAGAIVKSGRILIPFDGQKVTAYPDDRGVAELSLPPGDYSLDLQDIGRGSSKESVTITAGEVTEKNVTMDEAAAISFEVTDEAGNSLPCKAQFNAMDGTEAPNLGPTDRAHGCVDQYHSEDGRFTVQLPPGSYNVVVTHGPEFSHHAEDVTLTVGGKHRIQTTLKRLVDTTGWISADYHNHSTPSGDNTCGTNDRLINLAAEQVEFAPTTEHNRLYDWAPHIESLGLKSYLNTIPGMELTGRGAHFNAFPFTPEPTKQDGGAPVWQKDPRLNAIVLRDYQGQNPDRWVHLNHPDMVEDFIDRDGDGRVDGGYLFFGGMIDALESQNFSPSKILAGAPFEIGKARAGLGNQVFYNREFIWLQMLNQGHRIWGIAVSDAHHVYGNGVGGWRIYVPSSTDKPEEIDWKEIVRNSKAGRMVLSTGPFLEVETESGIIAGGSDRVTDAVNLKVKVQCTDWLDIDRVQVLVNGRQLPEYNYTRENHPEMFQDGVVKFDQTLTVALSQDSHIIVVATGENFDLSTGFGTSNQSKSRPIAYNNPIYLDVDGGGFTPSYDTLGFDLPVNGISVEEAKKALLIAE